MDEITRSEYNKRIAEANGETLRLIQANVTIDKEWSLLEVEQIESNTRIRRNEIMFTF